MINQNRNTFNINGANNSSMQINGFKKIKERMFYDATWEIYTSEGMLTIVTYDGISDNEMLNQLKNCKTVNEILALQSQYIYYD